MKINKLILFFILVVIVGFIIHRQSIVGDRKTREFKVKQDSLKTAHQNELSYIKDQLYRRQDSLQVINNQLSQLIEEKENQVEKSKKKLFLIKGQYTSLSNDSLRIRMINDFQDSKYNEKTN